MGRQKGVIPPSIYLRTLKIGDYVDIKVNKIVRGIQLKKRFHVRIEHIQPSRCREGFLKRRAENDALRAECKKKGEPVPPMKRVPAGPRPGFEVGGALETVTAIPYNIEKEVAKKER